MKSASKIPFKGKKTPYNLNEVDVNLLLKNPSSIRKVVKGNYKEENYHDEEDESEEDDRDEDAVQDDKLERHMKRYISEYFDNKYKKESNQRKKDKFDFKNLLPFKDLSEWEANLHRKTREYRKEHQEKSMKK
ncbi:MAG TPA: hypothetical protein PKL04_01200 [Methanofastidiosum sp.]|nr:hypothetical protein [Methanofastidiosum sp.]